MRPSLRDERKRTHTSLLHSDSTVTVQWLWQCGSAGSLVFVALGCLQVYGSTRDPMAEMGSSAYSM